MTAAPKNPPRLSAAQQRLVALSAHLERPNYTNTLRAVLPKQVPPDRVVRTALIAVSRNPALLECSKESLAESVLAVATWGLEIGRTAHIVPYGKTAVALPDWKGMVELAIRSKVIASCVPTLVHERDEFAVERGLYPKLHHIPTWRDDPGPKIAVYTVITFPNGHAIFDLMSKREVERIRDTRSQAWRREKGKRGPWETDEDEMWKKTSVRRALKLVPQNPILAWAVHDEDEARAMETAEEVMASFAPRVVPAVSSQGYVEEFAGYEQFEREVPPGDVPAGVDAETGEVTDAPPIKTDVIDMNDKPAPRPLVPDPYEPGDAAEPEPAKAQAQAQATQTKGKRRQTDLDIDNEILDNER